MAKLLKSHLHNLTRLIRLKDAQDLTRRIVFHRALIYMVAVAVTAAEVVLLLVGLHPRQSVVAVEVALLLARVQLRHSVCRRITLG